MWWVLKKIFSANKNTHFPQNELRPYVRSYIKSIRPCTDLISCFADGKTWYCLEPPPSMAVVKGKIFFKLKTIFCFYSQRNYPLPRTAIEAKILFAACVMQVRFLEAVIKPVHPCTGLIARFAQQNVFLLRTTDVRVGTEGKTPREQSRSGKKIGAVRQRKMHIKRVFG